MTPSSQQPNRMDSLVLHSLLLSVIQYNLYMGLIYGFDLYITSLYYTQDANLLFLAKHGFAPGSELDWTWPGLDLLWTRFRFRFNDRPTYEFEVSPGSQVSYSNRTWTRLWQLYQECTFLWYNHSIDHVTSKAGSPKSFLKNLGGEANAMLLGPHGPSIKLLQEVPFIN